MESEACAPHSNAAKVVVGNVNTSHQLVDLTAKAAEKLKEFMKAEKKEGYGLRIAVLPGGCSGYQTSLTFEKAPLSSDIKMELHGVPIYVDKMSESFVQGSTIDYVEGLHGTGFSIQNPNVKSGCGCGASQSY